MHLVSLGPSGPAGASSHAGGWATRRSHDGGVGGLVLRGSRGLALQVLRRPRRARSTAHAHRAPTHSAQCAWWGAQLQSGRRCQSGRCLRWRRVGVAGAGGTRTCLGRPAASGSVVQGKPRRPQGQAAHHWWWSAAPPCDRSSRASPLSAGVSRGRCKLRENSAGPAHHAESGTRGAARASASCPPGAAPRPLLAAGALICVPESTLHRNQARSSNRNQIYYKND